MRIALGIWIKTWKWCWSLRIRICQAGFNTEQISLIRVVSQVEYGWTYECNCFVWSALLYLALPQIALYGQLCCIKHCLVRIPFFSSHRASQLCVTCGALHCTMRRPVVLKSWCCKFVVWTPVFPTVGGLTGFFFINRWHVDPFDWRIIHTVVFGQFCLTVVAHNALHRNMDTIDFKYLCCLLLLFFPYNASHL